MRRKSTAPRLTSSESVEGRPSSAREAVDQVDRADHGDDVATPERRADVRRLDVVLGGTVLEA